MKYYFLTFLVLVCFLTNFSQKGKNGAGNIAASTVVNAYTSLTADAFIGNVTINVASSVGYATGDLIYIIQMQGASVNPYLVPFGNPNNPGPYGPEFGKITDYNNSGNNEYAQISSITGNSITIDCPLKNNYTALGKVQVIKVPRYTSLTIAAAGIITCPAWNGTVGGVIAIEVDGNTTLNAGGRIDASGLGFRGGAITGKTASSVFGGGAYGNNNINEGGYKGESIAGDVTTYLANFNGPFCKGAVANGGGGGNGNNAGGGGGANAGDTNLYLGTGNPDISVAGYVTAWNLESAGFSATNSSGGGRGGYSYSNSSLNPRTNGPNLAGWTGDNRRVSGGQGGRPLNYNTGKLFCGGGGGAGDENDAFGGAGGRGGGIINILSYGNVSGTGQITSNGENGFNSLTPAPGFAVSGRDGAGGAGGGGAIVINSTGSINSVTVSAVGGSGGNQQMRSGGATVSMAYGPGGGGGGGYIGTTAAAITTFVNGGVNGTVQYLSGLENCQIDIVPVANSFPANGATIGGAGNVTNTVLAVPTITASPDVTICINNSTVLTATTTGPPSTIGWYTNFAGVTLLNTGSAFTTSVFTTPGNYTIWAGFCPDGTYRDPVIITVTNAPTITATSATVCAGQAGISIASGATTYTWDTGSNSPTLNASPSSTTVYTVTGSVGSCSNTTTSTITVNAAGSISISSSTICSGQTASLTSGAALSYTWSTGANTQTVNVSPLTTAIYTLNATLAGGCIATVTTAVTVNLTPTLSVSNTSICAGETGTINASGASTYLWNTSATSASISDTPLITAGYTVVGANGSCTASASTTIFVTQTPTLSALSTTICLGQTASLTANGAGTYTWDPFPGANVVNPSFTITPVSTTIYTVIGAINNCTAFATASVVIGSNLSITVNSPTICSGQTATLTAISTATNFLWSNGGTTSTIFDNPNTTTSYTVTGSEGACTGSAVTTVLVKSTPIISVNSNPICSGGSATLTASGASTYSWSNGSNNTSSITVTPITNTTYTVLGETNSCIVTSVYNLTISPSPTITVNSPTICSGGTATLIASGANSYTWLPGSAQNMSVTLTPLVSTNYTVIGESGSCISQSTINITVLNNLVAPISTSNICQGQSATVGTSLIGTSYLWSNGAVTQSITVSPLVSESYSLLVISGSCSYTGNTTITVTATPTLILNSASICSGQTATLSASGAISGYTWNPGNIYGNTITVSPNITTNYLVTSANGNCPASATAQVIVNTKPVLTITQPTSAVCPNTQITLSANGATNYEWYVNNAYHFGNSFTITPTKNSTITLVGSNGGCSTTSFLMLNVSDVLASFEAESNYVDYPGTLTFTSTSTNATDLMWDFGNVQTFNTLVTTGYYENPGKYLVALVAKNTLGCTDTALYVIEVGCGTGDFYIPNSFTPNGDGLNDSFKIIGGSCIAQLNGSVYNRWGSEIFKWKTIEDSWDGKFKNIDVEIGVYNYLITYTLYNGRVLTKAGHISIIR